MHFTEPVYRNPYWPIWLLLEVARGCAHNKCKFCTMCKGVKFGLSPMEQIEEDLDCAFITHHAIGGANLTGPDFLGSKERIAAALRDEMENGDLGRMARVRAMKASL